MILHFAKCRGGGGGFGETVAISPHRVQDSHMQNGPLLSVPSSTLTQPDPHLIKCHVHRGARPADVKGRCPLGSGSTELLPSFSEGDGGSEFPRACPKLKRPPGSFHPRSWRNHRARKNTFPCQETWGQN